MKKELEKELPSLLLLDVMLPEEDGITILKKLRVRPNTRRLPVIMPDSAETGIEKDYQKRSGVLGTCGRAYR